MLTLFYIEKLSINVSITIFSLTWIKKNLLKKDTYFEKDDYGLKNKNTKYYFHRI